jgi:YbbR domain-containing protein
MFSFTTEQFTEREQRQLFFRRLFRRIFLEDWLLKLIALAITLALWLGVTGLRAPTTVRLKNVSLNPRVSNDMEITNSPVKEVDIVVTGDKRKVDRVNANDLVISVDLTDIKSGDRTVQLSPETVNLELPSGIKLDEIQPNKIAVRLERVSEREVEVKPDIEGGLAEGFEIYSQTVIPAKVRVRGAESFVKSLDSISTEKINVENRRDSFSARQVGLNILNPNVTVLDGIVDVAFRIGEKRIERMFVVPVKTENETRRVTVVLFGVRSVLENLSAEDLQIYLSRSETGETIPQLILPAELQDKIEVRQLK